VKKKMNVKKIALSCETIRDLTTKEIGQVAGGGEPTHPPSYGTGCKTCGLD
jgi:hypothetical protein